MSSHPNKEKMPHRLPADFGTALKSDPKAQQTWTEITPLARNEWICWVTSPKLATTRDKHIVRAQKDLAAGKRRPCCWPGCPHRTK